MVGVGVPSLEQDEADQSFLGWDWVSGSSVLSRELTFTRDRLS